MLFLGFSAGLPLLLVVGTLSFRLREAGIDRATISFLGWVGLAYGFKWIWAPLVDRLPIPLLTRMLGQRRSWLLASQLLVMAGLAGMRCLTRSKSLKPLFVWLCWQRLHQLRKILRWMLFVSSRLQLIARRC